MLSKKEKNKLKNKVEEIEKKTDAEIVPMVLPESDLYPEAHLRLAILLSFLACGVYYFLPFYVSDPIIFLWIQAGGLIVGYFLTFIDPIKRFLLLKTEVEEEVHQRALQAFYHQGVHETRDRTGVLVLISMLEHRVEILVDTSIAQKINDSTWEDQVSKLVDKIKNKQLAEGLENCLEEIGETLSQDFPKTEGNQNELKNSVLTQDDAD